MTGMVEPRKHVLYDLALVQMRARSMSVSSKLEPESKQE
jgi:hypothetical protein